MILRLVTGPTVTPVSIGDAKAQCRIDGTADDDFVDGLIAAATDYVERYTGRAIMPQTWELAADSFSDEIRLPKGPVSAVTALTYLNSSGSEQAVPPYVYTVDLGDPARIVRNSGCAWPLTSGGINAVRVQFVCGYSSVPASIKHAILLLVGDWYRSRENTVLGSNQPTELPHAVSALLANHRVFSF